MLKMIDFLMKIWQYITISNSCETEVKNGIVIIKKETS